MRGDMKPAGRKRIKTPETLTTLVNQKIDEFATDADSNQTRWLVVAEAGHTGVAAPLAPTATLPIRLHLKRRDEDWQASVLYRRVHGAGSIYDMYTERHASIAGMFGCQMLVYPLSFNSFIHGGDYFNWFHDLNSDPDGATKQLAQYLGEFGLAEAQVDTKRMPVTSVFARLAQLVFTGAHPGEV